MMSPEEKNKLKVRQICFIFLAFMPVTKLALLPSVAAWLCEEQLWLSALLSIISDICILLIVFRLIKKHANSTLYEVISEKLSEPTAKIVYFCYGVYFVLKALIPLLEQQDYIHNTLYEISPSVIIFLPFFIVSFYASVKGLKILGRCGDACLFFTVAGMFLVFFLSFNTADFTNLLPIMQKPTYKPINSVFRTVIWYSDSIYMLLFMGHFKREKHDVLKVTLSYGAAGFSVVVFMAVFYASFSSIAKTRFFATSELTIFSLAITNAARFDYLAIFLLMFSQVFAIILPIYLATKCFERTFGLKSAIIPAAAINLLLAVFILIFTGKLFFVFGIITKYLIYVFVFFGYVLPLLLLLIPKGGQNATEA